MSDRPQPTLPPHVRRERVGPADGPPEISLVCVYNSTEKVEAWLLDGLRRQSIGCELILVDNRERAYPSAASALNAGATAATAPLIGFIHQDVRLLDEGFLREVIRHARELAPFGVLGTAGATEDGRQFGGIVHGETMRAPDRPVEDAPRSVQTLDEQLLVVERDAFLAAGRFDEAACPAWDLYGVDLCLTMLTAGRQNYVLPMSLQHLSYGKLTGNYWHTLGRVRRKHASRFRHVSTACGRWPTLLPVSVTYTLHKLRSAGRMAFALLRSKSA